MPRHGEGDDRLGMFEYQEPSVLNQANPNINEWYPLLPITLNAKVYAVAVNIEDNDETLDVRVTRDGEVESVTGFPATHSTEYYLIRVGAVSAIGRRADYWLNVIMPEISYFMEGLSTQIEVRKTTANGNGNLTGITVFGVKNRVF